MGDDVTLCILAAGLGSRYKGFKQVDGMYNWQFLLDYAIYDALRAGFTRVVPLIANVHDLPRTFARRYGNELVTADGEAAINVDCGLQDTAAETNTQKPWSLMYKKHKRTKPLGTGHAVLSLRGKIDGPFGVINADDFYGSGSYQVLYDFLTGHVTVDQDMPVHALVGYEMAKVLSPSGKPVNRGEVYVDERGYVTLVDEREKIIKCGDGVIRCDEGRGRTLLDDTIASMNLWGVRDHGRFFDDLQAAYDIWLLDTLLNAENVGKAEFYIPNAFNWMKDTGRGKIIKLDTDEDWFGVTYPEDKEDAERIITELTEKEGVYPRQLFRGIGE